MTRRNKRIRALYVMKLRSKILLLAVVPLLVAMAALSYAVYQRGTGLAQQQKQLVEQAWLSSKEAELRHYVKLAQSAIQPLVADTAGDPAQGQAEALALLAQMEFGRDGYFFVYDLQGRSLMHPRQPELVGRDLSDLRDQLGSPVLRPLLQAAREHGEQGAVVHYLWHKPSAQREMEKLGYVVAVPQWGWMLGTGIYLDDIEAALAEIDRAAQANIRAMLGWVAGIAAISTLLVAGSGLALNVSDHRQADAKLRRLAQQVVQSQESERARLSRELHDGINQLLVSAKLMLEAALERLRLPGGAPAQDIAHVERPILAALDRLHASVGEMRRISHNLRPSLLDDLGLPAALAQLAQETTLPGGAPAALQARLRVDGSEQRLPDAHNTALFRVAQEALTNVMRHAQARSVEIRLAYGQRHVELSIHDDGCGFDTIDVQRAADRGIGLRNMRERIEPLGGQLRVSSDARGTWLSAWIPLPGTRPA